MSRGRGRSCEEIGSPLEKVVPRGRMNLKESGEISGQVGPIFRGILFVNTIMETKVVFPVERAKSRKKPKRINELLVLERKIG